MWNMSNEGITVGQMITHEINSESVAVTKSAVQEAVIPLLYDINQAATALNVSIPSVRKLLRQNRLRRVPDFRRVLIPATEVSRFASTTT